MKKYKNIINPTTGLLQRILTDEYVASLSSGGITLDEVKADLDIADAILKKHSPESDNQTAYTVPTDESGISVQDKLDSLQGISHAPNSDNQIADTVPTNDSGISVQDHIDATTGVHGITGNIVGDNDGQVLTNKMVIGADNIKGQYREVAITPYPFSSVCYFDGADYTDLTDKARTKTGIPFDILTDNNDRFYVSVDNMNYWYGEIYFAIDTVGIGINLVVEYFNEEDTWVDVGLIDDGTLNLTQSGKLFYNNPSDWKMTTINGFLGNFIRIRSTTTPTQTPTAIIVSPYETVFGVQSQEGDGIDYDAEVKADGNIKFKNLEITDALKGIILKSPDGTRWRITIDNDGLINQEEL